MESERRRWRWSNVPVPRVHVAGLLAGVVFHVLVPWDAPIDRLFASSVGATLIGGSLLIVGWSVRTVGGESVANPETLVTSGPYARSRNPMYVAWTGLYGGVALLVSSWWFVLALPLVLVITHVQIRREERWLERAFGEEYRSYRCSTPRYL